MKRIRRLKPLIPVKKRNVPLQLDKTMEVPATFNSIPKDVILRIIKFIEIQLTPKEACLRCGINYAYFKRLYDSNIESLRDRVEKAKLSPKILHLSRIHEGNRNWKASAWFLSRVDRANFGDNAATEENEETTQKIKVGNKTIEF